MSKIYYKHLRRYKYQLTKQYKINCPEFGGHHYMMIVDGLYGFQSKYFSHDGASLTIKRGYRWDGPSGPTIDTDSFMRGSLVHDVLYQAIREGHLTIKDRKDADLILYRICREDGMSRIRANYVYYGVRIGGRSSAISND